MATTERSLYQAINAAVTGGHLGDIGAAVERVARDGGLSVVREYGGHGIGRAVWSYKQMGFGLVDGTGRVVDEELVRICSQP